MIKIEVVFVNSKKEYYLVYNDCWLYVLLLTTLAILIQSLKSYHFYLFSYPINYGKLLLPGVYFLSNFILKKYDYKKSIVGIAVSGVISISFVAILSYLMGKNLILTKSCGDFCGYVVSQFVNLMIYHFLWEHSKRNYLLVLLTYFVSIIIYFMFYSLIYLPILLEDGFWMQYFITLLLEFVICIVVAYYDWIN